MPGDNSQLQDNVQSGTAQVQSKGKAALERRPSEESLDSLAEQKESSSPPQQPKSPMRSALEKAKRKLNLSSKDKGSSSLAGSEEEFQRKKEKDIKEQKRKEEYEKLGLGDKVKFGQGGMQMNG